MITTTNHFEVLSVVDPADCVGDMFAEPAARDRELLAPSAITIPPSDLPAVELPDYEPTAADLATIESGADERIDHRIASALTLSAFEARHRELLQLRAGLPTVALADQPGTDLERAA